MIRLVIQQKHIEGHVDCIKTADGRVNLTTGRGPEGPFMRLTADGTASWVRTPAGMQASVQHLGTTEVRVILDHPVTVTARLWCLGGARGRERAVAEAREITLHASDLVNREPDDESSDALINLAGVPLEVRDWNRGPVSFTWDWDEVDDVKPVDVTKVGIIPNKYVVTKGDGSPTDPGAEYFVLRLDKGCDNSAHRMACLAAVRVYALCIRDALPLLAQELEEKYIETPHSILCIPYAIGSATEGELTGEIRFFRDAIGVYRKGEVHELVTVSPTVVSFESNAKWVEMPLKKAES